MTIDDVYAHLQELQKIADAKRQPGRRHARLRRQRGLCRRNIARQGIRRPDAGVRASRDRRQPGKPALTVAAAAHRRPGFVTGHARPRAGCARCTLRPARPAGLRGGRLRDDVDQGGHRRRRRQRVLGGRQAERRPRQGRGRACSVGERPNRSGRPGRVVHAGLLPAAQDSGRGDRPGRGRGSCVVTGAPVRLVLDTKAAFGHIAKRAGADQDRRRRTTSSWSVRISTACASGPGINDNGPAWPRCWRQPLQLGAEPQSPTPCGSRSGGRRRAGRRVDELRPGTGQRTTQRHRAVPELRHARLAQRGYFTYDGDQSDAGRPGARRAGGVRRYRAHAGRLPEPGRGAAGRHAAGPKHRLRARSWPQGSRSGDSPPGLRQLKTEVQARLWGGRPGKAFDPNYHTARDTIDNVDRRRAGDHGLDGRVRRGELRPGRSTASTGCLRGIRRGTGVRLSDPGDELVDAVLVGRQRTGTRVR